MANYSISQLPTEATAQSTDLIETAIVDANSASGYASRKETLAVVGEAVVSDFQFPLLLTETTAKTITGAINEVAQNAGGNVADEIANLKTSTDATISGGVATFDALDRLPLDALTIGIEYTQSGSGTPSPDNVRTINGFASAVISVTDGDTTETKTISFGTAGTVYKGTLNVLTGELTVTHTVVDMGMLSWTYNSQYSYFEALVHGRKPGNDEEDNVFDCYAWTSAGLATMSDLTAKGAVSTGRVYVKNTQYTDADTFTAAMSGHYMFYELATSLSYQLTPTEIKSLIGANTVSADCGDVTICKYTALERVENQVTQYSTEEQKTGRKWIDGKDIYIKVIDFGALPNTTTKTVAHGITDLGDVVTLQGIATNPNSGARLPLPYATLSPVSDVKLYANNTNVDIETGYDLSATTAKIIIEYTKSV